jgi:hypothetical protein
MLTLSNPIIGFHEFSSKSACEEVKLSLETKYSGQNMGRIPEFLHIICVEDKK